MRQLEQFRKLSETEEHMRNNFRPVKPLNERTVYRSYEELGEFIVIYLRNMQVNYVPATINGVLRVFRCTTRVMLTRHPMRRIATVCPSVCLSHLSRQSNELWYWDAFCLSYTGLFYPRGIHSPRTIWSASVTIFVIFSWSNFSPRNLKTYWTDFLQIITKW